MNRDEALDLIPLAAGGDLDAATTAAVLAAIDGDPIARDELRAFEALDAQLRRALAPPTDVELPAWLAPAPSTPMVKRHCPYCKDDLAQDARVLCASCLTPHHQSCFSENRGCSLLGCGSTRCIAASDPASAVCATCGEQSPAAAPFCAWCGSAREAAAAPLHARGRAATSLVSSWLQLAAAATLLLSSGLLLGMTLGDQYGAAVARTAAAMRAAHAARTEESARDALRAVVAAQRLVRGSRFSGYAPSAPTLLAMLGSDPLEQRLRERIQAIGGYDLKVARGSSTTTECFYAVAVPIHGEDPPRVPVRAFFVNQIGEIEVLAEVGEPVRLEQIDPTLCVLRKGTR